MDLRCEVLFSKNFGSGLTSTQTEQPSLEIEVRPCRAFGKSSTCHFSRTAETTEIVRFHHSKQMSESNAQDWIVNILEKQTMYPARKPSPRNIMVANRMGKNHSLRRSGERLLQRIGRKPMRLCVKSSAVMPPNRIHSLWVLPKPKNGSSKREVLSSLEGQRML